MTRREGRIAGKAHPRRATASSATDARISPPAIPACVYPISTLRAIAAGAPGPLQANISGTHAAEDLPPSRRSLRQLKHLRINLRIQRDRLVSLRERYLPAVQRPGEDAFER